MIGQEYRDAAADYLFSFVGTPYIWGGDDPSGFDCSGLAIEWMKAVGILPRKYDNTADGLLRRFEAEGSVDPGDLEPMDLVFWLKNGRAVHVETIWDPVRLAIGASGGGPTTTTVAAAATQNAFVKMRRWDSRPGPHAFVDPFMAADGGGFSVDLDGIV